MTEIKPSSVHPRAKTTDDRVRALHSMLGVAAYDDSLEVEAADLSAALVEFECLRAEVDTLREHKRSLQSIVIFANESYAAVCAELSLSYEAELETVLKAIRDLRAGAGA